MEATAIVVSPYDPRPEASAAQSVQVQEPAGVLDQDGRFRTEIEKIEDRLRRVADEAAQLQAKQQVRQILSGSSVGIDDLTVDELDVMVSEIGQSACKWSDQDS